MTARQNRIIAALLAVIVAVACGAGMVIYLVMASASVVASGLPALRTGPFSLNTMEAVVAKVRKRALKPGEEKEFRLSSLSAPSSLRPLKPGDMENRGEGAGHVWARMSSEGKLTVVIETRDLGHAGEYGFAYSDVPLTPKPFGDGSNWLTLDVPGRLNLGLPDMKINERWWEVVYNLD
jgi:hypothetical protein